MSIVNIPDRELAVALHAEMSRDDTRFTPWEIDFVDRIHSEVTARGLPLSMSQREKLEEIYKERIDD